MSATVADNIARMDEERDDAEVVAAAQRAGAHELLLALPQGYDTQIGAGGLRLSGGQRQRVALARALYGDPPVLILDEPTVGLDPKQIIAIRELIRELGQKRTLLLSTHILPEVEQLCDRVFIIDRGHLVAEGTPQELRDQAQGNAQLTVTLKEAPEGAAKVLGGVDGVLSVTCESQHGETRFAVECDKDLDLRETVFRTAVDRGWTLLELMEEKASLEDIFVRLTGDEGAPPTPPVEAAAAAAAESGEGAAASDDEEEVAS